MLEKGKIYSGSPINQKAKVGILEKGKVYSGNTSNYDYSFIGPLLPKTEAEKKKDFKAVLMKDIKFDTLQSDIQALGSTLNDTYNNWQSPDTLKKTKQNLESMYNRLFALREYNKLNGDTKAAQGLDETVAGYKSVLDDWDELTAEYGKFKNAEMYQEENKHLKYAKYTFEQLEDEISRLKTEKLNINNEKEGEKLQNEIDWLESFSVNRPYTKKEYNDYIVYLQGKEEEFKKQGYSDDSSEILFLRSKKQELQNALSFFSRKEYLNEKYYSLLNTKELKTTLHNNLIKRLKENGIEYKIGYNSIIYDDKKQTNQLKTPRFGKILEIGAEEGDSSYGINDKPYIENSANQMWQQYATSEEKSIYAFLYLSNGKNGLPPAKSFANEIKYDILRRKNIQEYNWLAEKYERASKWEKVKMNLDSIPQSVFGDFANAFTNVRSILSGVDNDPFRNINWKEKSELTRQLTSEDIDNNIKSEAWSKIATMSYQGVMQGADSALRVALLGPKGSAGIMAVNAGAEKYRSLYERGASSLEMNFGAALSAGLEFATELIGGERVLKTLTSNTKKKFLKNLGIQLFSEPIEELVSKVGDAFIENSIMGEKSELNMLVNQYIALGYTKEEARIKANKDFIQETFWEMYTALISSGASGMSGAVNLSVYNVRKQNYMRKRAKNLIGKNNTNILIDVAMNLSDESKARNMAKNFSVSDINKVGKVSELYSLVLSEVNDKIRTKTINSIARRIEKLGEAKDSLKAADIIYKMAKMQDVSKSEMAAVKKNNILNRVYDELVRPNQYTSQWVTELAAETENLWNLNSIISLAEKEDDSTVKQIWDIIKISNTEKDFESIDTINENSYNNIRGDNNELSNERGLYENQGGMQRTGYSDTRGNSEVGRTREESQESFTRRTQENVREAGQGRRILLKHGKGVMSYVPKGNDSTPSGSAVKMLQNAGIEAFNCDGTIESNENGITTIHTEAITTPDGKVYVSSNTTKTDVAIAAHESVHSNMYQNTEAYSNYEAVVCDNILYNSEQCERIFTQINDNHYGSRHDISNPDNAPKFIRELTAYINEFVVTDQQFAEQLFSDMFDDWSAVVEAAQQFNNDIGLETNVAANDDMFSFREPEGREITKPDSEIYDLSKNILPSTKNRIKRKKLTLAEKQTVRKVGEALDGTRVEFFETEQYAKENNIDFEKVPDSYEQNGVIYINESAENPLSFLFGHEFFEVFINKHTSQNDKGELVIDSEAQEMINAVLDNKGIFLDFVKSQCFSSSLQYVQWIAENRTQKGDTNFVGKSGNEKEARAGIEAVANFIGEKCSSDVDGLIDFANTMNAKQGNKFIEFVKNAIAYLKSKLQGLTGDRKAVFDYELSKIESKLASFYQNSKSKTDDSGKHFSYVDNSRSDVQLNDIIKRLSNGENISVKEIENVPSIKKAIEKCLRQEETYHINTPERQVLRNNITQKLLEKGSYRVIDNNGKGEYNGKVRQERRIDIVIGPPAAGKSSVLVNPLSQQYSSRVIDSDMAKEELPEYNKGIGANAVHEESKVIIAYALNEALKNGDNIVYPIVGGGDVQYLIDTITEFKNYEYNVHLHLNELDINKALGRAINRYIEEGRFIPPQVILSVADTPLQNFNKIKDMEGLVDGYSHYSNDVAKNERPIFIERKNERELQLLHGRRQYNGRVVKGNTFERQASSEIETDSKNESVFSSDRLIGSNEESGIDLYTESRYNNYGWVRANDVLTAAEYGQFSGYFADHKIHKNYYVKTKYGDSIIPVGKKLNVLVYASGGIKSPKISKVVRINEDNDYFISQIRSDILEYERQGHNQPYQYVEIIYGEESISIDKRQDLPSFQRFRRQREGNVGTENSANNRAEQNGRGNVESNTENEAGLNESAFSVPEKHFSYYDTPSSLLDRYDNGEITREQMEEILSGKRKETLKDIADLTPEDASTTPQRARKTGKAKGDKISNTYDSLLESDIFDDTFKDEVKTDEFVMKYESVTNKEILKQAADELDAGGQTYVNKWWVTDSKHASLIDTAVGFILMDRYQRIGDYESAVAVAEKVREFGTASGQQVQIFSILGRLDPNTMAVYAQRDLSKAFEMMSEKRTQRWIDKHKEQFRLTDEDIEFIRRKTIQASMLPEGRDKAIRLGEISALLQDKLPAEKGQGIKAIQRICMLLNPKTNIRNVVGNGMMVPAFIASDFFGSQIDKIVSKKTGVRTTGNFDIKSVKGLKKGAFESLDDFKRHINTRNEELNRFEIGAGKSFNENKKIQLFNDCAKLLNALDRFTSFCLEIGDRPFYEMWFINSLNNQMKLNNVSEATPEMIEIANNEALQRTWQDSNKMVKAVAGTKKFLNGIQLPDFSGKGIGYGLGDVLVKFTKTPANLTKAIFDFSPVGLLKSLSADALILNNAIKKGRFEAKLQKKFVNNFSKGIAGTFLYVMAAALAKAGYIRGGNDDEDKDVKNFESYIQGIPAYSIKLFGKWFSYDWAQPVGSIMATVGDYMKYAKENPDNEWYENVMQAIRSGGTVLYNQSFMKSIQILFTADNFIDGIIEEIMNEPSIYIPQAVSQIANSTDEYRRSTYENGKPFRTALNNIKLKIPGLRQTLPKQVDAFGRDIKNAQSNVFDAFFNPGNTYTNTSNAVSDEVYRIYKQTGLAKVIPRVSPYDVTVKGIKHTLSLDEKNDFQRISGNISAEILKETINREAYKSLKDEEKAELVSKIYTYATAYAKSTIDWDYEALSAMVGYRNDKSPILSKEMYNKLSDKGKEELAREYFLSKRQRALEGNNSALVDYWIGLIKN